MIMGTHCAVNKYQKTCLVVMCSSPGSVPVPSGRLTPETVCLSPWSSSVTHF